MSEEEKAVIFFEEILEEFKNCNSEYLITKEDEYGILKYLSTLLNLIEKQQNRIDELEKALIDEDYKWHDKLLQYDKTLEKLQKETIWKHKIEDKIKDAQKRAKKHYDRQGVYHNCNECNNTCDWYMQCATLKELLEE